MLRHNYPVFLYAFNPLVAGVAYTALVLRIKAVHGTDSALGRAIGSDWKGKFSLAAYVVAMATTFVSPILAVTLTAIVALIWLVPDRRIEAALAHED